MQEAGLDRRYCIQLERGPVVRRDRREARKAELCSPREAEPATRELLSLLPDLRVVVLVGDKARDAWAAMRITRPLSIATKHPSARNLNAPALPPGDSRRTPGSATAHGDVTSPS